MKQYYLRFLVSTRLGNGSPQNAGASPGVFPVSCRACGEEIAVRNSTSSRIKVTLLSRALLGTTFETMPYDLKGRNVLVTGGSR